MSGTPGGAQAGTPSAAAQGRGAPQGQRGFVREVESKGKRPFEQDGEDRGGEHWAGQGVCVRAHGVCQPAQRSAACARGAGKQRRAGWYILASHPRRTPCPPHGLTSRGRTVAQMMYGFGDARNPLPASVNILEDIVCEFITKMVWSDWGVALACAARNCKTVAARADAARARMLEQTKEAVKLSTKRGKKLVSARCRPCCPVQRRLT